MEIYVSFIKVLILSRALAALFVYYHALLDKVQVVCISLEFLNIWAVSMPAVLSKCLSSAGKL